MRRCYLSRSVLITASGPPITISKNQDRWTGASDLARVLQDNSLHLDVDTAIDLKLTNDQHPASLVSDVRLTRHITLAPSAERVAIVLRDASSGTPESVFAPAAELRAAR